MILLRKYLSADDPSPREIQIDELDFELFTLFLKEFMIDEDTHHLEVIRLWGKLSNVETVEN